MSIFQLDFFLKNISVSFTGNLFFIFTLNSNTVFLSLQCFQSHFNLCENFTMNFQVQGDVNSVRISCVLWSYQDVYNRCM